MATEAGKHNDFPSQTDCFRDGAIVALFGLLGPRSAARRFGRRLILFDRRLGELLCGGLIATNFASGILSYALILIGTRIWAISEVGLDGWALIPHFVAPCVLGLWIFSP